MKRREYDLGSFLKGEGTDAKGRTYAWILSKGPIYKEACHDYVQFLFPTDSPSAHLSYAPVVSASEAAALGKDPAIRGNLSKAASEMLGFLKSTDHWHRKGNHNYERISRMLRSLALFGLDDEAAELLAFAEGYASANPALVDEETLGFWRDAAGPVW